MLVIQRLIIDCLYFNFTSGKYITDAIFFVGQSAGTTFSKKRSSVVGG